MLPKELSNEELLKQIRDMEAKGFTVINSSELRALKYEFTHKKRMSNEDIMAEIKRRKEEGLSMAIDTAEHLRMMSERENEA